MPGQSSHKKMKRELRNRRFSLKILPKTGKKRVLKNDEGQRIIAKKSISLHDQNSDNQKAADVSKVRQSLGIEYPGAGDDDEYSIRPEYLIDPESLIDPETPRDMKFNDVVENLEFPNDQMTDDETHNLNEDATGNISEDARGNLNEDAPSNVKEDVPGNGGGHISNIANKRENSDVRIIEQPDENSENFFNLTVQKAMKGFRKDINVLYKRTDAHEKELKELKKRDKTPIIRLPTSHSEEWDFSLLPKIPLTKAKHIKKMEDSLVDAEYQKQLVCIIRFYLLSLLELQYLHCS